MIGCIPIALILLFFAFLGGHYVIWELTGLLFHPFWTFVEIGVAIAGVVFLIKFAPQLAEWLGHKINGPSK